MKGPSRGGTIPSSNPRRSLCCRSYILGIRVPRRWSRMHSRNSYISTSIISPLGWRLKLAYKPYLITKYTLHNRIYFIYYLNSHARHGTAVLGCARAFHRSVSGDALFQVTWNKCFQACWMWEFLPIIILESWVWMRSCLIGKF